MKSLILTRVETSEKVKALVNSSKLFKIAVNRADYEANARLFHDAHHWRSYLHYKELLVTRLYNSVGKVFTPLEMTDEEKSRFLFYDDCFRANTKRKDKLYFACSSLIPAIDLAIKLNSKEILLIADGNVGTSGFLPQLFIPQMNIAFKKLRKHANIYMFQKGFYDLPVMSIKEFYEL